MDVKTLKARVDDSQKNMSINVKRKEKMDNPQ
jgi:hypothetical protein